MIPENRIQRRAREPRHIHDRCIRARFRSNLNTIIDGRSFCPIHAPMELDKKPTIREGERHLDNRAKRRAILARRTVIYENIPNTLVTD